MVTVWPPYQIGLHTRHSSHLPCLALSCRWVSFARAYGAEYRPVFARVSAVWEKIETFFSDHHPDMLATLVRSRVSDFGFRVPITGRWTLRSTALPDCLDEAWLRVCNLLNFCPSLPLLQRPPVSEEELNETLSGGIPDEVARALPPAFRLFVRMHAGMLL